jgi:hypothetical protein
MSVANKPLAFKFRDVGRLVRAARAEGINPTTVEVDTKTGKIRVTSGAAADTANTSNEWDQVYDNGAAPTAIHK